MFLNAELDLTPAEERAVDVLLESIAQSVARRLPPTLELSAVGLHLQRPCAHAFACQGDAPEELH